MSNMSTTRAVSQCARLLLKRAASWNMARMVVADDTSHLATRTQSSKRAAAEHARNQHFDARGACTHVRFALHGPLPATHAAAAAVSAPCARQTCERKGTTPPP